MRGDLVGGPGQIQSYLEAYAKRFGIDDCVTFNTSVMKVDPVTEEGVRYRVGLQNEKTGETYTRGYENVIVANGHHWDPAYPDLPGHFSGLTVHAHDYRTNEIARGKRCLVLGVGNSGQDTQHSHLLSPARLYLLERLAECKAFVPSCLLVGPPGVPILCTSCTFL